MQLTATDALTLIRAHLDADEVAVKQWLPDSMLLSWFNRGLLRLYRKMIRAGMVHGSRSSAEITAPSTDITIGTGGLAGREPLVIYHVAEVRSDGTRRFLTPSQPYGGPVPPSDYDLSSSDVASTWWVQQNLSGDGSTSITIHPIPRSGTYEVVWHPVPLLLSNADTPPEGYTNTIFLPAGMQEYPILDAVRSGFAREQSAPPSVTRMLQEMDEELDLAATTLSQGWQPAVRNVDRETRGWVHRRPRMPAGVIDPSLWVWLA